MWHLYFRFWVMFLDLGGKVIVPLFNRCIRNENLYCYFIGGLIVQKETNRPLVLASIIIAMFITAIEGTIVATAMPSIVADLGGFSLFSWVFSAFLLTQVITIPVYGKLADLFGRKPVFIIGTLIFLFATVGCGFSHSMKMLILFRLFQGVGAGAIQPIATTIVGDLYSIQERAKVQGYISSVWGISSIVGPALGGVFVQYLHWSWVFWVNIPLGILSILGLSLFLHEKVEKRDHRIDYLGSGLLFAAISSLMVILIQGGVSWPWVSIPTLILGILFIVGITVFIRHEFRAPEPVMPMSIWQNRLISVSNFAALTSGIVMIGVSVFLPTYVQGVMGRTPMVAGFTLSMMSIGWPLAATLAGRLMLSLGARKTALAGGILIIVGSAGLVGVRPEQGPVLAAIGSFFVGVGMGLTSTTFIVSIQSAVEWKMRGAATASNMFMRMLGNTVGAAFLGSILNAAMNTYLKSNAGKAKLPVNLDVTNILLDPVKRKGLSHGALQLLKSGLSQSLHSVYLGVLGVAALTLLLVVFLPKEKQAEFSS